ncbi:MAG: hypothetical protein DRP02_10310 [Candidatus Gerdarchaeota archaeon]|nr:MAG: hypothetical protein DRO63_08675 [Candidatus Gerdarchaeota archaeon]RLI69547.1 MAG: hypothetical protein DRP02_10310 [Candidatus Gerdarchaeota archaeon]
MSEESLTRIPGTTFSIKFGLEGKYYALFLCRGSTPFKSKPMNILKGTTLRDLPEEIEKSLKWLLDTEEIYLSPVVVDRVVNEIIDQIPKEGQVFVKETIPKKYINSEVSVQEIIKQANTRAEKVTMSEYTPASKPKVDASADDIGKIHLREPRPLPQRQASEDIGTSEAAPVLKPTPSTYQQIEEKFTTLTNDIQSMQELLNKNAKEIKSLKRQVKTLKKEIKALKKPPAQE